MKSKYLVLILAAIVAAAGIALLLAPKKGMYAVIFLDGELYTTIDLNNVEEPYTIQVGGGNTVRVEKGRVRMESADCPDKLCVNQGWSSSVAKPIVCLPNKVMIIVENEPDGNSDNGLDAVTG